MRQSWASWVFFAQAQTRATAVAEIGVIAQKGPVDALYFLRSLIVMEYEHHLVKVPAEGMQKVARVQQKALEKDFLVVENAVRTLLLREQDDPNVENTCNSIAKIVTKLCGVKRKLQDFEKEGQVCEPCCTCAGPL